MLELVARKRTPDGKDWERFIVTVEGDDQQRNIRDSLEVGNYPRYTANGEKVIYTPLQEKLHLLNYLMVVHQKETLPTVKQVWEAFQEAPTEIQEKAWAFEWHHGFFDFAATDFFELDEKGKWVALIALLTKEDTGKELPGVKLKFDRPIGMSDEQWNHIRSKYSQPYYGYVTQ